MLAFIMYTSGTTGKPKGVVQSHLSIFVTSLANVVEVSITSKDIAVTVMPMFQVAQHALTTSFIHVGATQVIFKKFDPEAFAATVAQEKVTWVFLLPMMYRALMAHPAVHKDQFASVRYCLYAMTPMDEVSLNKAIDYFEAEFALATGQTEMYPATVIFKPEFEPISNVHWDE
ncbi:MAG: AMP-binding protein [Desulfitobacteriaceae bacterium]|nr:AMP-binding protein [Desulfitobacteriaceae bacterium]